MLARKYQVLLFGYYGFGNLGDELLLSSITDLLLINGMKKEQIAVLSSSPNQTENTYGIKSYNRHSIWEVITAIRNSKTLLLGGGGLFQDVSSKRSCLFYWLVVRLARFLGAKQWAVGQSIGPLRTEFCRFLAKDAFSLCTYRGVRDTRSLDILNDWGLKGVLTPDYAVTLKLDIEKNREMGNSLLLNVRKGYQSLSDKVIKAVSAYAKENVLDIIAVAFSSDDFELIQTYIEKRELTPKKVVIIKSMRDFETLVVEAKLAVGMRYHFLLLACLAKIPTCAAIYDPKVASLCDVWLIPNIDSEISFSEPAENSYIERQSVLVKELFKDALVKKMGII